MSLNLFVDKNPITVACQSFFKKFNFFAEIANYLQDLFVHGTNEKIRKILFLIGVCSLTYQVLVKLRKFWKNWNWIISHIHNVKKYKKEKLK